MEIGLGVLASLMGLGYAANKNGVQRQKSVTGNIPVPPERIPTGTNIYNSKKTVDIWNQEQQMMNNMYKNAQNPEKNIVIPGPPLPEYNKVDYQDDQLPVTFKEKPSEPEFMNGYRERSQQHADPNTSGKKEVNDMTWTGGGNYASTGGWVGTSLSGNVIDPKNFRHRNMTPFFGSTVRQNVDQYANQTLLENFTGSSANYREKKEISPMFKPQRDVGNPYGVSNLGGYNLDRYVVGNKRNNEAPVEKVYVGPGLNQGYTSLPSGGFQQANKRDYILPKTTNEIRTKTNPKLSYYGRIIAGKHISRPTKIGLVQKNRPDSFYLNTPDRWFTTTGEREKAKIRPHIVVKNVNRKTTGLKSRAGPAGPAVVKKSMNKGMVRVKDTRKQLSNGGWRNLRGDNAGVADKSDFGKSGLQVKPQARSCTGHTDYRGIANPDGGSKAGVRTGQKPRPSRKQNFIGNNRTMGNADGRVGSKGWVKNPNDVARTTTKQTTINSDYVGGVGGENNNRKGWVKNPNDVARTTTKQTTINSDYVGGVGGENNNRKGWVKNPNDIARTTIKQTTINSDYVGGISGDNNNRKGYVKNPNDVAKTTIKETTQLRNYVGNSEAQTSNNGYKLVKANAKPTNRQTTTRSHAGGAMQKNKKGAYGTAKVKAPNTNRQFTSDVQYFGTGNSDERKPRMMDDINNAEIHTHREEVAQGRAPTRTSQKVTIGSEGINLSKVRDTEIENESLRRRGTIGKGSISIPDKTMMGNVTNPKITHNRDVTNERLDSEILDQLQNNELVMPSLAQQRRDQSATSQQ